LFLSTVGLRPEDQFEAWRNFMSPAIEFDLPEGRERGFTAQQTVWDLGSFALTRALMPTDGPVRTWRHLGRDPLDHWCLVLVRDTAGAEGGRTPRGLGQLYFRSLGTPFEGSAQDEDVLSLYIPRDLAGPASSRLDRLPPSLGHSPLLDLLADYMVSLSERLPEASIDDIGRIAQATKAMISSCLIPNREEIEAAQQVLTTSLIDRAQRLIRQELFSPELSPEFLARSMGISRSGLYRLFEPLGGVRHAIQRERLHFAHAALADTRTNQTILDIAERAGFGDASGFSRAFRHEFGYSPSHARASATLGAPLAAVSRPKVSDEAGLGGVLRRLRV